MDSALSTNVDEVKWAPYFIGIDTCWDRTRTCQGRTCLLF